MSDDNRKGSVYRNAVVLVLFAAMGLSVYLLQSNRGSAAPELEQALVLEPPRPVKWAELVAHDGSAFTPQDLKGQWSYLYMGYRSCPDVCPIALTVLGEVSKQLSALKLPADQQPQFLFVSVDPRRDTPELLAEYVEFFGEDFIGITGKDEQLKAVAIQMGGIYMVPENPETEDYEVGHSNSVYLMNPDGQLRVVSQAPHDPEMIVRNYLKLTD